MEATLTKTLPPLAANLRSLHVHWNTCVTDEFLSWAVKSMPRLEVREGRGEGGEKGEMPKDSRIFSYRLTGEGCSSIVVFPKVVCESIRRLLSFLLLSSLIESHVYLLLRERTQRGHKPGTFI